MFNILRLALINKIASAATTPSELSVFLDLATLENGAQKTLVFTEAENKELSLLVSSQSPFSGAFSSSCETCDVKNKIERAEKAEGKHTRFYVQSESGKGASQ